MSVQMIPVKSSNIAKVGHDHKRNILVIEFKEGGTYEYNGVSRDVYKEFMKSTSFGTYFSTKIRGVYKYRKL